MSEYDLGIRCSHLLSMSGGKTDLLENYFLGIQGPRIAKIAPWNQQAWHVRELIDARGNVVMPGLVNGHTHLAMSLFRGLADDLAFADWLHRYIIPLESKLVDRDFVRVGTELSALESIRCGVTTLGDMYYFADAVAETLDRAGLRGVVGEAITDFPVCDNKNLDGANFRILDEMRARYPSHERIIPCVAPHTPYTCGDDTMKKATTYAEIGSLPLMIHVSETRGEVQDSLKKYSKTPVKRIYDLGVLNQNTICSHCVHVTDEDIDILAKTGASAIYNPESNMKLGSGVAPVPKMLACGVKVGIGTDGPASNNDLSIFREMDTGAKVQKLIHEDNMAMTAQQALDIATHCGAKALGIGNLVGTLEEGKLADVIIVDFHQPHMQPLHNVASQLVYVATGMEVDTTICHGRILFQKGQFKTMDAERIQAEVNRFKELIQSCVS